MRRLTLLLDNTSPKEGLHLCHVMCHSLCDPVLSLQNIYHLLEDENKNYFVT